MASFGIAPYSLSTTAHGLLVLALLRPARS